MNDNFKSKIIIEEKKIDLKDILYYICKKWRVLLFVAVLMAVLVIIFKIPTVTNLNDVTTILKQCVKYALIGMLIGLVLACFVYTVSYISNGKIKSENEFTTNCRLSILGILPQNNGKKLNGMDKLIRRMYGINRHIGDFDTLADRLAEEIKAVLSADNAGINDMKDVVYVSVVSTESDDTEKELVNLINSKLDGTAKITVAGNILKDAESVRTVMKSDKVIMLERIAGSRYQMIEETYKKLYKWKKEVVGIVLLDGDVR